MNETRLPRPLRGGPRLLFVAALLGAAGGAVRAQEFHYRLDAPGALHRGEVFEAAVLLESRGVPDGAAGPEGWQIALAHERLEILEVTTSGTAVDGHFHDGFELTEITSGPSNEGFTSVVILSLESDATLPPEGIETVARATYRVPETACRDGARLVFRDGLRGSGQTVDNRVSWQGASHAPSLGEAVFDGCEPNRYRLSLEAAENPLGVPPGETGRVAVTVVLEQDVATASAWNLAVAHDPGDLRLLEVTLDGTGVDELLRGDGFALLEVTRGASNTGFVAQVALSAEEEVAIPRRREPICLARYELVTPPPAGGENVAELSFADELEGSGDRITNRVSPAGNLELAPPLALRARGLFPPLTRGDANADASVDMADAVTILGHLFLGGTVACREAADTSADGGVDLSDAIFLLNHLFLGGPPLPPPYPECGSPPSSLGCDASPCR